MSEFKKRIDELEKENDRLKFEILRMLGADLNCDCDSFKKLSTHCLYCRKHMVLTTANNFKPLGKRVMVELIDNKERTTSSGLIVPVEESGSHCKIGIVKAIGSDVDYDLKINDRVFFFPPINQQLSDKDFIVQQEMIYGVFEV